MQPKFRLYRRSSRSHGTYYAQDCVTGARESLGTKDRTEAERLLQAKNETVAQPAFNREMAKVYLRAQDPAFCQRTWKDVANVIDAVYDGSTKRRFAKFVKSVPMKALVGTKLIDTGAEDFLTALGHEKAGVSTNVQLRILHNRAIDLGWLLHPVLSRKAWPETSAWDCLVNRHEGSELQREFGISQFFTLSINRLSKPFPRSRCKSVGPQTHPRPRLEKRFRVNRLERTCRTGRVRTRCSCSTNPHP